MKKSFALIGLGVVIGGLVTGGVSYAVSSNTVSGTTYRACAAPTGVIRAGTIRLGPTPTCKVGDTVVSWNTQGPQGIQGVPGTDGNDGAPGVKGDKGDTGDQGIQGLPGANGNDGAPGAKGDRGDQGIQGATGTQGPSVIVGSSGGRPTLNATWYIGQGENSSLEADAQFLVPNTISVSRFDCNGGNGTFTIRINGSSVGPDCISSSGITASVPVSITITGGSLIDVQLVQRTNGAVSWALS